MRTPHRSLLLAALLVLALAGCGENGVADDATPETVETTPPDDPATDDPATDDPATDDPADDPATDEPATDDPATDDPATDDPATDDPAAGAAAEVAVASTDLGDVLVDGEGMTLYLFEPDDQGPSTCDEDCTASWPPLLTDGDPMAGEGVDQALLGTVERDDGSVQATYNDWPLYRWAGDTTPGEASGQGVGDVWWVLDAEGNAQRDQVEQATGESLGSRVDY